MGFFEQVKEFFIMCAKGVYSFLTKTIEILWEGIKFTVRLIYNGSSLVIDFIVDGVLKAYDFIFDSIQQLRNAGIKGNYDKLKQEISKLKDSNAEIECFTYKIKNQDAKTVFV